MTFRNFLIAWTLFFGSSVFVGGEVMYTAIGFWIASLAIGGLILLISFNHKGIKMPNPEKKKYRSD